MRLALLPALCAALAAGCAGHKSSPAPAEWSAANRKSVAPSAAGTNRATIIVTSGAVVSGRISLVNPIGFVVVTFPLGVMPAVDRRLNVYRNGLKVAELKVSKEQLDVNTVADILTGECRAGDEVRED